jgi:hypothetical protein
MENSTIDASWVCLALPIGIIALAAILGTRSRLRYANRIREAQARGAFPELSPAAAGWRVRSLAILAVIGVIGVLCSLVILALAKFAGFPVPPTGILASAGVFGAIAAVAGFLMKREIDRRL